MKKVQLEQRVWYQKPGDSRQHRKNRIRRRSASRLLPRAAIKRNRENAEP